MPIQFNCSQCGRLLQIPDDAAGRRVQCPECQHIALVPAASTTNEPAPEKPSDGFDYEPASSPAVEISNPYQSPSTQASPYRQGFDTGLPRHLQLSSRATRLVGAIVDWLLLCAGILPGFVLVIVGAVLVDGTGDEEVGVALMILGGGVALVGFLAITVINWILITNDGQTIAKRWLGMRIVDANDACLPGFVRGVILRRWAPFWINQACGLFSLIDVLFIFGDERQCIHDLFATTKVIDVHSESQSPETNYL